MAALFLGLSLASTAAAQSAVPGPQSTTCGGQGAVAGQPATTPPWMIDPEEAPAHRARALISAMTLPEMEEQMAGQAGGFPEIPACSPSGRHVPGIPALCIPTFRISNGPSGVGAGDCAIVLRATSIPSTLGMTAGFDPALTRAAGDIIGSEARDVAVHVIEGPAMDMLREAQGGRNFEYASEDPYLAGLTVSQSVIGDQAHGIIGMCKHFMGNEQETNRTSVSDIIDERSKYEMYFVPFNMCTIDGGARSVMCAYNLVNGVYECQDYTSMTTALRQQWGFKGYVQSDFGATHSTAPSLLAGEDLEMSSPVWFTAANLDAAIAANEINQGTIENALLRRYTEMFAAGDFDRNIVYTSGTPTVSVADTIAHGVTARLIGEQDSVLFRNANNAAGNPTLPLTCDPSKPQTIALIGPAIPGGTYTGGGGSSMVRPLYTVTPFQGLLTVCPTDTIRGYAVANPPLPGTVSLATAAAAAAGADLAIVIEGDEETEGLDRSRIYMPAIFGVLPDVLINRIYAAQPNTIVVLLNGDPVPLGDPNVYTVSWADEVPAILETWYPGEEGGNIIADLLFNTCQIGANPSTLGDPSVCTPANPSGKTSITFPVHSADVPQQTLNTNLLPFAPVGWPEPMSIAEEYPGTPQALSFPPYISAPPFAAAFTAYPPISTFVVDNPTYVGPTVYYSEGLQFGYRWYESQNIKPRYPFGFGLSYTTFEISDVDVTPHSISTQTAPIIVRARVTNTGRKYGAEVVQVYLGLPGTGASFGEPPKRLVGFKKVWLNPGESRTVTIKVNPATVPEAKPLEVEPLEAQLSQDDPDEQAQLVDIDETQGFRRPPRRSVYQPLAYWDTTAHSWAWASGHYTVYVGNSSANTPFTHSIAFTSLHHCNGVYTGTFEGNTTVLSDEKCTIVDGKITGKVLVHRDGQLTLIQATVGGVVHLPRHTRH
ncbi:MAG TPA: glycoside hydrolase family 3 C-terminal domain-containing protein [Terriglobales bacterium]|nr:glycoside hydrolase family 3 C-terminal domain-containing protein [Terriglobales bacterium]